MYSTECSKCHYKQLCKELPTDMSCEDIQKYAKAGEEPPEMEDEE